MSKGSFYEKLDELMKSETLDKQPFGKSKTNVFWIKASHLEKVSSLIKHSEELKINRLENITCFILDSELVFTYFFLSSHHHKTAIIRFSVEFKEANTLVELNSLSSEWPSVFLLEKEISEMFGVSFLNQNKNLKKGFSDPLFVEDKDATFYMRENFEEMK